MGKATILKIGDKEILSSELNYEYLVLLFEQFVKIYNRTPLVNELKADNNLPCSSKINQILKENNLTYAKFCASFGGEKTLLINGTYKFPKDVTYDDLIILYKEYINKFNKAPTSSECTIKNNLPHRAIINDLLNKKGISHNDFLNTFGITDNRQKYKPIQIGDIFGRWKVIKEEKPKYYGKHMQKFWKCECTCGSGIQREISDNALKTGDSKSCGCLKLESNKKLKGTYRKQNFEDWCNENNHSDFLTRWDYNKNKILPSDISYVSHEKVFFKCPCNKHKSSLYQLSSVITMKEIRCKYCNSFAQRFMDVRGNDALEKFWDYDKNKTDPWELSGSSKNKIWLKCIDTNYHGSYQLSRDDAIKGYGCPYCNHSKIHPKDSFGQAMINRYGEENFNKMWNKELNKIDPFTIAPSTRKYSVWLNCLDVDYHPPTKAHPNDVNNHSGYCHYCAKQKICKEDSLGYKFPNIIDIWSSKNTKSPYEYFPQSNKKVWWKCASGKHKDFQRTVVDAYAGEFGCPKCNQESLTSRLQRKVSNYINDKYNYSILHENECNLKPKNPSTNNLLRYDNEIPELKLIIEVHGKQHYEICGFTKLSAKHYNTTPEEELKKYKARDKYKMNFALERDYSYLIIPYWFEDNDKYKELIDNKINELLRKTA